MLNIKKERVAVILVGPSGSGKSTLEKNLKKLAPNEFHKVLSATTREIRVEDGEKQGESYNYVSKEEFDNIPMVESVEVVGNFYGIPSSEFETEKDLLLVVDPHGAEQCISYLDIPCIVIFMNPPHEDTIENMQKRGDSEEKIAKRVASDDIEQRFNDSDLVADKVVKKLTQNLHLDVYEFIQIFKKNL